MSLPVEVDLDQATRAGIIGEDQAIALRNLMAQTSGLPASSQEKFSLIGGLADVMQALGLLLLFGAAMAAFMEHQRPADALATIPIAIAGLVLVAMTTLTVARKLARFDRPASAAVMLFAPMILSIAYANTVAHNLDLALLPGWVRATIVLSVMVYGLAFWRISRFPVAPAIVSTLAILSLVTAFVPGIHSRAGEDQSLIANLICIAATLPIFALAIWLDVTDIRRETTRSQIAFWLHVVAGMLMTRAVIGMISVSDFRAFKIIDPTNVAIQYPAMLIVSAVFVMASLLFDRRSMLFGCVVPNAMAVGVVSVVLVGLLLLTLSSRWLGWRAALLNRIPARLAAQLPRADVVLRGQRPTRRHLELLPRSVR